MLTASTATKRKLLLVSFGWCTLLLIMYVIGERPRSAGLLTLVILSIALLYMQYRGYALQASAEKRLANEARKLDGERIDYANQLKAISGHDPILARVLGGSGSTLQKDTLTLVSCRKDCLVFSDAMTRTDPIAKFDNIVNLEISGPGTEHTNAGMVGGGFGIEGALKGILIASGINQLTTKSKTNTFLRMSTNSSETFFHMTTLEPTQLRMLLSPAIVKIEANRNSPKVSVTDGFSGEISKLHHLLQAGVLTQTEYLSAKQKLLK